MSIKLMNQVWESPEPKGLERMVLLSLADQANDEGYCWPKIETIAKRAAISKREAQRCLKNLCSMNILSIESRYRQDGTQSSNLYRVTQWSPPPDSVVTPPMTPESPQEPPLEPPLEPPQQQQQKADVVVSISPVKILSDACGLPTFPANQNMWIEVVYSMAESFGVEETTQAMKEAAKQWRNSTTKDTNQPYRITNLNWINLAQEKLLGNDVAVKNWRDMNDEELADYLAKGGTTND